MKVVISSFYRRRSSVRPKDLLLLNNWEAADLNIGRPSRDLYPRTLSRSSNILEMRSWNHKFCASTKPDTMARGRNEAVRDMSSLSVQGTLIALSTTVHRPVPPTQTPRQAKWERKNRCKVQRDFFSDSTLSRLINLPSVKIQRQ